MNHRFLDIYIYIFFYFYISITENSTQHTKRAQVLFFDELRDHSDHLIQPPHVRVEFQRG